MDSSVKWIIGIIEKENENLLPVLGSCSAGKLEIRAFLLEKYLEAVKKEPLFNQETYHALNELVDWRMFSETVHEGEDRGEAERKLQVAVMMDKMMR